MGEQIICVGRSAFEEIAKSLGIKNNDYTHLIIPSGVKRIYCDPELDKERVIMTREEAKKLVDKSQTMFNKDNTNFINALEALGLLKFEEPKADVTKLCSAEKDCGITPGYNFRVEQWNEKDGNDRFVFWANGEIVWKSWKP